MLHFQDDEYLKDPTAVDITEQLPEEDEPVKKEYEPLEKEEPVEEEEDLSKEDEDDEDSLDDDSNLEDADDAPESPQE
jgi:hypothetical protein